MQKASFTDIKDSVVYIHSRVSNSNPSLPVVYTFTYKKSNKLQHRLLMNYLFIFTATAPGLQETYKMYVEKVRPTESGLACTFQNSMSSYIMPISPKAKINASTGFSNSFLIGLVPKGISKLLYRLLTTYATYQKLPYN